MCMENAKKIAVLGAGFGGLRTARTIDARIRRAGLRERYQVALIDRNAYQIYTPTLYEAATTSKKTANYCDLKQIVTFPVPDLIKGTDIAFIHAAVHNVNLREGHVQLSNGDAISFDWLVLALGSETNYFGIPGVEEHALPLKTFMDAIAIRDRVFNLAMGGAKDIRIVIGGGGSTGVELAGELSAWVCDLQKEFKECGAHVTIVEAAPTLLSGFDPALIKKACARLQKLGVEMRTNEVVTQADEKRITLESGLRLPYDVFIWTGGVKASRMTHELPLKTEEKKRQIVAETSMECLPETTNLKLSGAIYGLGDAVCFTDPATGKPVPKVARAALIQADIVAHNIMEDIFVKEGKKPSADHKRYVPKKYPYVIPIGGKYAIAKIGPLLISGFFGWVLKGLIEFRYLLSIMGIGKALRIWLKGLHIFIQNDRLG